MPAWGDEALAPACPAADKLSGRGGRASHSEASWRTPGERRCGCVLSNEGLGTSRLQGGQATWPGGEEEHSPAFLEGTRAAFCTPFCRWVRGPCEGGTGLGDRRGGSCCPPQVPPTRTPPSTCYWTPGAPSLATWVPTWTQVPAVLPWEHTPFPPAGFCSHLRGEVSLGLPGPVIPLLLCILKAPSEQMPNSAERAGHAACPHPQLIPACPYPASPTHGRRTQGRL